MSSLLGWRWPAFVLAGALVASASAGMVSVQFTPPSLGGTTAPVTDAVAQFSIGLSPFDLVGLDMADRPPAADPTTLGGWGRPSQVIPVGPHSFQPLGHDWAVGVPRDSMLVGEVGQISAFVLPQTADRAVVPAPGAVLLASIGAACLGWLKRRA